MDKVGVYIQLFGESETTAKIKALKQTLEKLEKDKTNITVTATNAQATLKELQASLNEIKSRIQTINGLSINPKVKSAALQKLNSELAQTQALLNGQKVTNSTQTAYLARNKANTTYVKSQLATATASLYSDEEMKQIQAGINAYRTTQDEVAREINSATASSKNYNAQYAAAYAASQQAQRTSYVKYWEDRLNAEEQAANKTKQLEQEKAKAQEQATKQTQTQLKAQAAAYQQYYQRLTNIGIGLQNVGQQLRNFGMAGTMYFTMPTVTAGVASVKAYSNYDYNLRKISTILEAENQLEDDTMTQLAEQVTEMSKTHAMSQSEILNSMYQAISAGVSGTESAQFVEVASELAEAGFSDSETVTDLLTSIVNAYDGFDYNKDTLYSISDMLLQTQNYGKIIVDQMASVLPQVIPIGNTYGVGFQDILASLVTLTKQGITASSAGTYLTQLMSQLGKTSGNAGKLFAKSMGSSFTEYMKTHTLDEALVGFQNAVEKSGDEVGNYLTNKRALAGYSALMGNLEDFQTQQKNIADAAQANGAITSAAYEEMAESLSFQIEQIKTNLTTLGVTIGSILAPKVLSGIDTIQGLIDTFNSWDTEKQEQFLSRLGKIALAFPITWFVGSTLQNIGNLVKGIAFIGKAFGGGILGGGLLSRAGSGAINTANGAAGGLVTFGTRLKAIGTAFVGATAFVGVIAEIGAVIYEYGKVIEAVSNLNIGENYTSNMQRTIATAGLMTAFGGALTGVFSSMPKATQLKALFGEGLTAGFGLDIALLGEVFKQYGEIVQSIADLNIGDDYDANLLKVSGVFAVMSAIVAGLTTAGGMLSVPMAIGEVLAAGFIGDLALLGEVTSQIADTVEHISEVNISSDRVDKHIKSMTSAMASMAALLLSDGADALAHLPSDIAGHLNIREMSETIEPLLDTMAQINNATIPSDYKMKRMGKAIESLSEMIIGTGGEGLLDSLGSYFETLVDSGTLSNVKNGIDTITTILNSVGDMTTALTSATTALDSAGGLENVSSKMTDILTALIDTLDAVSTGEEGLNGFFSDVGEGIGIAGENFMLSNIGKALTTITSVLDAVTSVQTKLNGISTYSLKGEDANGNKTGNSFAERIDAIMYQVKSAMDAVAGANAGLGEALAAGFTYKAYSFENTAISKAIGTIGSILDSVVELQTKLNSISTYAIGGTDANGNDTGKSLSERVATIINEVNEILSLVGGDNENAVVAGWEALAKKFDEIKIDEIKSAFEKVGELVQTVANMQNALNSAEIDGSDDINALFDNLKAILTNMATIGTDIPSDTSDIGNWQNRAQVAEQMLTSFEQLKNVIVQLKAMESLIEEMEVDENGGYVIGQKIQNMLSSIMSAFNAASTEESGVNLENIIMLGQMIQQLISLLQVLSNATNAAITPTSNLGTAGDNAKTSAENLDAAITSLSGSASGASMAMNSLASSGYSMVDSFNSAAAAATALTTAINAIPSSKTVNISTVGNVSSVHKATGGSIFRKRGTDTVPAMLTAGEYVIRKSSAQLLGSNVLNRLNHADLTGAMMALSNKVGLGGYSVNNTKNYNNNAQVTQNIVTNNPNYSYRRARRWAMAL